MSDSADHGIGDQADAEIDAARRFLLRYKGLAEIVPQAIWAADPQGTVFEEIPGWQRMTGLSWDETRSLRWLSAVHPDDRETVGRWWSATVRRRARGSQEFRLRMADSAYRHVRACAIPVFDAGRLVEWVGTCVDIEQEWQQEQHRRLLDEVAAATADIAGLVEVLSMLSRVIVPKVADGCAIYLIPEYTGRPVASFVAERVAGITRDELPPPSQFRTEHFDPGSDFVTAVRTGRPVHHTFPAGAPPPGIVPPGAGEWYVRAGVNSMTLVPVVVDGSVAAVVSAVVCGSRRPIDAADIDLLGRMLDHAHPHLSNALRFQQTQRVALALQHSLLPDPPDVPGVQICARYRPSGSGAEIGGDWYDSFRLPDGATILTIGDVAGHDLDAAVTMSQLRNLLRSLVIDRDEPPGHILRRLDMVLEALYDDGPLATCILARLEECGDRWRLRYSVAGHPPPLLITAAGDSRYLQAATEPLLGVARNQRRSSVVEELPPDSTLLFYTDGLVERPGEHLDEGLERLRHHAAALARAPLDAFCDQLLDQVPMADNDDIAMIAARLPEPARPT